MEERGIDFNKKERKTKEKLKKTKNPTKNKKLTLEIALKNIKK
jgi:hypothetical protein